MDCEELTFRSIEEKANSCCQMLEKITKAAESIISPSDENCVDSISNVSKWACK
jgi:hypothetical protein